MNHFVDPHVPMDVQYRVNGQPGAAGVPPGLPDVAGLVLEIQRISYLLGKQEEENKKLRDDQKRKRDRDSAYAIAIRVDDKTGSIGNDCLPIALADFYISGATKVTFDPLDGRETEFHIHFEGGIPDLVISRKEYLDDKMLVERLRMHTRRKIYQLTTRPKLAAVFRDACTGPNLTERYIAVHGGWRRLSEGKHFYEFQTIGERFIAYQTNGGNETSAPLAFPDDMKEQAREGLSEVLKAWRSTGLAPKYYWMAILLGCTGFLCSLVRLLDHQIPMGVCIQVEHPEMEELLLQSLDCYGEGPVEIGGQGFCEALCLRKDGVLLLVQGGSGKKREVDYEQLIMSVSTGTVSYRRNEDCLLQVLPVAVVNGTDQLEFSDHFLPLSVPGVPQGQGIQRVPVGSRRKFFQGLAWYVHQRVGEVEHQASHYIELFNKEWLPDASRSQRRMLGILCGILQVLVDFTAHLGLPEEGCEAANSGLVELLTGAAEEQLFHGVSVEDVADAFVLIVKSMLKNHELEVVELKDNDVGHEGKAKVVYEVGDCFGFSETAIQFICEKMMTSRTKLIGALDDCGWLLGAPAAKRTKLTRKIFLRADGSRKVFYFFKMQRSLFEETGEIQF